LGEPVKASKPVASKPRITFSKVFRGFLFFANNKTIFERRKTNVEIKELLNKPYLNEKEVAAITGRGISTLRNDRFCRRNLPYYKMGASGRSVRYKTSDVLSFIEGRRITFDEV